MSRQRIPMQDGSLLVIGYDGPFETWFALHYDDHDEDAPPRVAIGYTPVEQEILLMDRPDAVVGPFPVTDPEELCTKLIPEFMGIEPEPNQDMCRLCGTPPWQPSETCYHHPYNVLRET
jgi:hypothetical protein